MLLNMFQHVSSSMAKQVVHSGRSVQTGGLVFSFVIGRGARLSHMLKTTVTGESNDDHQNCMLTVSSSPSVFPGGIIQSMPRD